MTRLTERISHNLRQARRDAGLSQQRVAELAKVAVATVTRLESGKTANPRGPEFERIAAALGTTADTLMGMDDEPDETEDGNPTDEELDAEIEQRSSDPDILLAFMARVRDPRKLSRTAKLAVLEDLRKIKTDKRHRS